MKSPAKVVFLCLCLIPIVILSAYEIGISSTGYVENQIVISMSKTAQRLNLQADGNNELTTGITSVDNILRAYSVTNITPQFPGAKPVNYNGRTIDLSKCYIVTFESGADIESIISAFKNDDNIENAEPIGLTPYDILPGDPQFGSQKHLSQDNDHDIDAPEAWECEDGSSSIILALLDSGVRYFHKDLGGADASYANPGASRGAMWINWAEKNGSSGVDDDDNGYTDDWIGWDFISGDNNPVDEDGHGTHMAGIAAAGTNDGYGVAGVAGGWNNGSLPVDGSGIRIMPLRVGGSQANMAAAAQAFFYAADNGAKIASCSWLSENSGNLGVAIDYFLAMGGIIFKSAGNINSQIPDYICGRTDTAIIAVASVDSLDHKADFTNYGLWVDVCAPGTNILSTNHDPQAPVNDLWSTGSGTSTSAPMAAAVAALIWSKWPEWTRNQVADSLKYASTDNINMYLDLSMRGKLGIGRINASKLICASGDPHDWTKTYSFNSADRVIDLCCTPDGGYVSLVNGFEIVGSDSGNYQIYLQKMNSYGHAEWTESFNYGSTDRLYSRHFISASDGGFAIVGEREQTGTGWDISVIKTDPYGKQVWNRTFGGTSDQKGLDIIETSDGDFLITGTAGNSSNNDVLVMKVDGNDGDSLWTRLYGLSGSNGYEEGRRILSDPSGDYVILGSIADTAIYLLWLDEYGDTSKTAVYTQAEQYISAFDFALSSDYGNIIAATIKHAPPGDFDDNILLVKIDSDGDQCWAETFGDAIYNESYPSVIKTLDSGYIVAGYTDGPTADGNDLYLIKTNACGALHWELVINETIDEYPETIIQTADEGYLIGGGRLTSGEVHNHSHLVKIPEQPAYICGDIQDDAIINILDIVYLINYMYKNGPAPDPVNKANVNCDDIINIVDITYLQDFKYKAGPPPCPCH